MVDLRSTDPTPRVIEPGQLWQGLQRDHLWRVKVLRLSLSAVQVEVLGRGAGRPTRLRGNHQHQWIGRRTFLGSFELVRDNRWDNAG